MTNEEILKQIEAILCQVLKREDINIEYTTTANDVDGWDSLNNMIIVSNIEKHFNCKFSFREIVKFKNIGDLCDSIMTKIK